MVRTAVILASDDKGMAPVFGIPAARRLTLHLVRLGFTHIHLVGRVNSYVPVLSDLVPERCFHPVLNGESLERVVRELGIPAEERVLVLKANLVADRSALARFLAACGEATACRMEIAGVRGRNDGLYLADQANLVSIVDFLWSNSDLDPAVLKDIKEIPALGGLPSIIEDRETDAGKSEDRLVKALGAQTEADDGLMARYFDRHISQFVSRRLAHTGIMPNHITLIGMTLGLIGALLLSLQGYWVKVIGSFLFVVCVIVDGVDGEVARLKMKESTFGHYLDIVTDNIVHAAIFVGIAFGLYHDTGDAGYLGYLWVLLGGFCVCLVAVYVFILRLDADTLSRSPKTLRIMALVTNRDFAYLVFALAVIGRLSWFLLGAALGSYAFAIVLCFVGSRERRTRAAAAIEPPASSQ
ncbi:MAG TPA: CDP-alcohol phosphatidyltransferase family protein [Syntrophobacter fumaroxidans]|nr:CDP-alcohol phosphatidyltransferase family protein [Syntrophobacter fumaroxidans]